MQISQTCKTLEIPNTSAPWHFIEEMLRLGAQLRGGALAGHAHGFGFDPGTAKQKSS
jgi:hypothetical protein